MTTPYIEAKKAEARKQLEKRACYGNIELAQINAFFDEFLESFLSEIEGRVVEEIDGYLGSETDVRRLETAFQHLRTGEENITS